MNTLQMLKSKDIAMQVHAEDERDGVRVKVGYGGAFSPMECRQDRNMRFSKNLRMGGRSTVNYSINCCK